MRPGRAGKSSAAMRPPAAPPAAAQRPDTSPAASLCPDTDGKSSALKACLSLAACMTTELSAAVHGALLDAVLLCQQFHETASVSKGGVEMAI